MTDYERLLDRAREVAENSYSPYSKFRVGAVVVAEDGTEYVGVNVENAAYGSTICAEASAITAAATAGVHRLKTAAVACLDADEGYPCGNCRQLMREFEIEELVVADPNGDGVIVHKTEELLPHSFGPEHLR